ncbi:PadR family transcriptional regulator [Pandoraea pulmonicola]|uniref:PadR family transcriptional regulator n=1 Tax=Pandoraea pulmonicola TaxID=93221 RepID=A0AAJ4Z894_PANPU|nr:PadR family transcriptional regulator [Pandoraea pulmonicola]AJC22299.1 PadR family transcriptional regulator [Pandoraea pulmonicola]SUA88623.1 transcriptional regulator, Acidobacterial, PadR-family [Pandoraea pulmonicola]
MPLAHALMTSLLEKSSSGYDLARRFDKSIGFFWHATHQQIYRELARMEACGWIESGAAPDGGRTRKRIYRVLDAGRDALRAWASTPTAPSDLRDDLMVRLRADAAVGPLGLQDEFRRRAALHAQKLAAYQAIEARDFPPGAPLSREQALQRHILHLGVRYEQGWLDWTQEALALLVQWDGPDAAASCQRSGPVAR